ncbi:tryptophan 7-halogenase [Massilia terrae]|uniref:Tryptophan 7-halogenase n=1 Tax=Massilia terrae TaxID=1811224 RepID=A0ABT2D4R0_9BURK|nr:tryptophan halogenase family protein [Massilia terrae]MCS0661187.1 tryptophan 7-halogenase [Massilia terrae]
MTGQAIREILIVGGGTAGWMAAAGLSRVLPQECRIRLVESEEIGTVGVGEASIPSIRLFNEALGIDEDDFLRHTQGSFKLGIEFVDWGGLGQAYFHGFGTIGQDLGAAAFHHYWLKLHQLGEAGDLADYAITSAAPRRNKFMRARRDMPGSPMADLAHAFHFDAGLYARYLRRFCEARGVLRTEGRVQHARLRAADGFIESVVLASGEVVEADLFIDCSGFRGLLIEGALHTGFDDWSHWLPCDRALAVPGAPAGPLLPYTRCTAGRAGWRWRIPLQHRIGHGHVYSSKYLSDDEAAAELLAGLDGEALAEPRLLRFVTGKRRKVWNRNCVAMGLAAGFMEPLESTSIHLVQSAIARLAALFPTRDFRQADTDEFNRQTDFEYERIRDFLILHYHQTARTDSPFWNFCRTMDVPETLLRKIELFKGQGRIFRENSEMFSEASWFQVMHGQGLRARGYHPLADAHAIDAVRAHLQQVRAVIARCVDLMPTHEEYVAAMCRAA